MVVRRYHRIRGHCQNTETDNFVQRRLELLSKFSLSAMIVFKVFCDKIEGVDNDNPQTYNSQF